jgi:hypothetical protein
MDETEQMTQNKSQMLEAHYNEPRYSLSNTAFDVDYRQHSTPGRSRSHGHLSKLLQSLRGVFINEKTNLDNSANNDINVANAKTEIKDDETQTLRDLEICANAARETEACGQYEWVKSSDE